MSALAGFANWSAVPDDELIGRTSQRITEWLAEETAPPEEEFSELDEALNELVVATRKRWRRSKKSEQGQARHLIAQLMPLCEHLTTLSLTALDAHETWAAARGLRASLNHALCSTMLGESARLSLWRGAHKLYANAEQLGLLDVAAGSAVAPRIAYTHLLLFALTGSGVFKPRQADRAFEWLANWATAVTLDEERDDSLHSFCVDLQSDKGPLPLGSASALQNGRYFNTTPVVALAANARTDYFRTISVATLGLYEENPLFDYYEALDQLARFWGFVENRRRGRGTDRVVSDAGSATVFHGFQTCREAAVGRDVAHETWRLVDVSRTGAGFSRFGAFDTNAPTKGELVTFRAASEEKSTIGTIVRTVAKNDDSIDLGVQVLATTWRTVQLLPEGADAAEPGAPLTPSEVSSLVFFIFGDESSGLADSLIMPAGAFDHGKPYFFSTGGLRYQVRLTRVIQRGQDWERVGFDVQKRHGK
jgi:hypothetical protein